MYMFYIKISFVESIHIVTRFLDLRTIKNNIKSTDTTAEVIRMLHIKNKRGLEGKHFKYEVNMKFYKK